LKQGGASLRPWFTIPSTGSFCLNDGEDEEPSARDLNEITREHWTEVSVVHNPFTGSFCYDHREAKSGFGLVLEASRRRRSMHSPKPAEKRDFGNKTFPV